MWKKLYREADNSERMSLNKFFRKCLLLLKLVNLHMSFEPFPTMVLSECFEYLGNSASMHLGEG